MSLDSFMNKAYSVVNLLSLALGNETAAKRQIILSSTVKNSLFLLLPAVTK